MKDEKTPDQPGYKYAQLEKEPTKEDVIKFLENVPAPTVATDNSGDNFEKEKREAKEWELWRDFLYEVGCNRRFLDGAVWEDTEWEKLMDILKKDFTITRKS